LFGGPQTRQEPSRGLLWPPWNSALKFKSLDPAVDDTAQGLHRIVLIFLDKTDLIVVEMQDSFDAIA
jgi:hypothetical protein